MSMGRIYISGRISGLDREAVRRRFGDAARALERLGYEAVNPLDNGLSDEEPWERHMAADIDMLLACGIIYMLSGWEQSRGARLEHSLAIQWGKTIVYEHTSDLDIILDVVSKVFDVEIDIIKGESRKDSVCMARIAFAGIAARFGYSPSEIAGAIGRKRSTVVYYTQNFETSLRHSYGFERKVDCVYKQLTIYDKFLTRNNNHENA